MVVSFLERKLVTIQKRGVIAVCNSFTPNLASRSPLGRSLFSLLSSNEK